MGIKDKFKKIRDGYVINQVYNLKLPNFEMDSIRRYRVVFDGRVQKVGFRLEVCELAHRLNLTGFCKNLKNGKVLAELQGPGNKIDFLISHMESLKRINIVHKVIEEIEIEKEETGFIKAEEGQG